MDEVKKMYRTAAIIGLAMIAGVFIYAAVVEIIRAGARPVSGSGTLGAEQLKTVKIIFFGLSAGIFFVIRTVQARILASISPPAARDAADAGRNLQRLLTSAVVTYALCEAPAVLGLVVFFLGRDAMDFYLFML